MDLGSEANQSEEEHRTSTSYYAENGMVGHAECPAILTIVAPALGRFGTSPYVGTDVESDMRRCSLCFQARRTISLAEIP